MRKIEETASVEFIGTNEKNLRVIVNSKKYSLYDFFKLCKYDQNFARILLAIKKKMKTERYPDDNIIDFIIDHFGFNDKKLDVVLKNGVQSNDYYPRHQDSFAVFDDGEVDKGYTQGARRIGRALKQSQNSSSRSGGFMNSANDILDNDYRNSRSRR